MQIISGYEAIARMRQLRNEPGSYFKLIHLTYNATKDQCNGMRIVPNARLRKALPDEVFQLDSDLYLPYTDLDLKEPRMCFKKLIRFVAFPPDFKLMKVNHFTS